MLKIPSGCLDINNSRRCAYGFDQRQNWRGWVTSNDKPARREPGPQGAGCEPVCLAEALFLERYDASFSVRWMNFVRGD
jgi:hypothetical protein